MSKKRFDLTKLAMNRMEFLEDGKIAFTYLDKQDLDEVNAEVGDHEGIVELGRDVEGVEISIFLRGSDEGYKVSLRSNDYVNVSDICLLFGGGGHIRAAGGTINLPFEQAKEKILNACKKELK
ncbi:MAG: DHHA1 domain-containing protein [Firmicutes bacterium]|nr:DHHA1 domain-containing protein [Bacillota bacterium]